MSKLVVHGRTVVCGPGNVHTNAYVEIHDGRIYRLTNFPQKAGITADVIMPGFIDPHVHCRDWNQSGKEGRTNSGNARSLCTPIRWCATSFEPGTLESQLLSGAMALPRREM